jgi:hypothetical protein
LRKRVPAGRRHDAAVAVQVVGGFMKYDGCGGIAAAYSSTRCGT